MITAKHLPLPVSPPSRNAGPSWWVRFGAAMNAVWRLRVRRSLASAGTPADRESMPFPVAGKIVAITVTGSFARPARKMMPGTSTPAASQQGAPRSPAAARRPGVQGRWKASDRVPML